ncbi:MAG: DUF4446 family protein, partial [Candidatus Eremiobacteraeota bacterium]|nr:DUF4446 family protein [Candidatus Eremiobacteraeota bacterium]
ALRALRRTSALHDEALGGGAAGRATERFARLERMAEEAVAKQARSDERLAELERIGKVAVPRVGFVRYNAFDDVGSDLSYALALLNKEGDGVVISSIYSREDTRTYGKAVRGFSSVQDASKEELAAIEAARAAKA